MKSSNDIFFNASRDDSFNKIGECLLSKLTCRGNDINCRTCCIPALFSDEARKIIRPEPEPTDPYDDPLKKVKKRGKPGKSE